MNWIEKDGLKILKEGNRILGYVTESVNNIGFGYSFDKPSDKESFVFYGNSRKWIRAEAMMNLQRRIEETKEILS